MREVYAVYLALFSQSFLRFCGRKNEGDHVWGLVNAEQQTRVFTVVWSKKEFANPYLGSSGTHDLLTQSARRVHQLQMLAVSFAALSLVMPAPRGAASHRLISSGPLRTGSCATMLEAAQAAPLHGFLALSHV